MEKVGWNKFNDIYYCYELFQRGQILSIRTHFVANIFQYGHVHIEKC